MTSRGDPAMRSRHAAPRSQSSQCPASVRTVTAWATDGEKITAPFSQLQKVLLTWMNVRLRKAGSSIAVRKLSELHNKRSVHRALLAILGETIPENNGTSDMTEEDISADDWSLLEKHQVNLAGVTKDMVESGDVASGLALLWCLFTTMQTKLFLKDSPSGAESSDASVSLHTRVHQWFSACVATVDSSLAVRDLHHSWCDGLYYRAVLKAVPASEVRQPPPELDDSSSITDNLQQLKDYLGLDADRLLTETDMQSKRSLESKAMLVHLALIYEQFIEKFPIFSKSLVLSEVAAARAECTDVKAHLHKCQLRYSNLCPDDPECSVVTYVTENSLRECHHAYFIHLLVTANGKCHHKSGDCQATKDAAGELYGKWQNKRKRVWQALLADRMMQLHTVLEKEVVLCSHVKAEVQEQLPCTDDRLPILHGMSKEAVSRISRVSMEAKSDIRHIERFVEQNSTQCVNAMSMLTSMSLCQRASSVCKKYCAECSRWLEGMTQASQYMEQLDEVERAISDLHSVIDSLSSYDDLKKYLSGRKQILEKVMGFDEKLQSTQEKVVPYLQEEARRSVTHRIERGHYHLSQLASQQQQHMHKRWAEFVEECEASRSQVESLSSAENSADMTISELQVVSKKLHVLERCWAQQGDNSNPSMCISSQISTMRSVVQSRFNERQAALLMSEIGDVAQQLRSSMEEQSSSINHELDYSQLQEEMQHLKDLERLMLSLDGHVAEICRLLVLDADRIDSGTFPSHHQHYTRQIQSWQVLSNTVKEFLPGRMKRLEFYSYSSPLQDELARAKELFESLYEFTGPLDLVQRQLEDVQTFCKEKLERMRAAFNKLGEVGEELADLQVDFDEEESTLHKLGRDLEDVKGQCSTSSEKLAKSVAEWRLFTDEVEQTKEDVNNVHEAAKDLVGKVEETVSTSPILLPRFVAVALAFEVQMIASRQEYVSNESEKLLKNFRQELHNGCQKEAAEEIDEQLQALMEMCERTGRKAQWLSIEPGIWIHRTEKLLEEVNEWPVNDQGPTDTFVMQLGVHIEQTADVLERSNGHASAYAKRSPDPQRTSAFKSKLGDHGDLFDKAKMDSGVADLADFGSPGKHPDSTESGTLASPSHQVGSLPSPSHPSSSTGHSPGASPGGGAGQMSPASPSIQVTPSDSPALPSCASTPTAAESDAGQLTIPAAEDALSENEVCVKKLAASLHLVKEAAGVWDIQAALHTDLRRRLGNLEQSVRECDDIEGIAAANGLLSALNNLSDEETPIIQDCLLELAKNVPGADLVEEEAAYTAAKHWRDVHDKLSSRLCSIQLAVEGKRGHLEDMLNGPLQLFSTCMNQLHRNVQKAMTLVQECDKMSPAEMTDAFAEDVEAIFGFEGEEAMSQMLTDCEAAIDLIASLSETANVEEYASQLEEVEGRWQEVREHECLSLTKFCTKNRQLLSILENWATQLDRADALTAFDDGLDEEADRLQIEFSADSSQCQYANDCLASLAELSSTSVSRGQELTKCFELSESRHAELLTRSASSIARLWATSGLMHPSQKLEELRKLVARIELQIQTFGALLDSVEDAQTLEHTIQSAQGDLDAARQQQSTLIEDETGSETVYEIASNIRSISNKIAFEADRLSRFHGLWANRLTYSATIQQRHATLQVSLKSLSELTSWHSTLSALKIMLENHTDTANGMEHDFRLLSDEELDLLEYVSEPFAHRISDETQSLGKHGDEVLSAWHRWKEAYMLWRDVLARQQSTYQCLDSIRQCCNGRLLAAWPSQEGFQNQLVMCREEVALVSNLISNAIGSSVPQKFKTEVEGVSSGLAAKYASVETVATVFFSAAKSAYHLKTNIDHLMPAVNNGITCLVAQSAVLGPADAIVVAQAAIKEYFTGDRALSNLESVIESCYETSTELTGALGRAELRASQFPEFSVVMEHVGNLKRETEHLGVLHGKTCAALESLLETWSTLQTSCEELRTYVVECRKQFPTLEEMESASNRHEVCTTRLADLGTSIRTAQRKAAVVQATVGELQTRCESDGSLCDRLTRQYRDVKTYPVALEVVGKLLEVVVSSAIAQPLLLANEADLHNESIKCQVASQSLAGLRKRLDSINASVRASHGKGGDLSSLASEEAVVKHLIDQRTAVLTRLREMWGKAKKEIGFVMDWCRDTKLALDDLLAEEAVEMSTCSDQLGRVQGMRSQLQQYQEKMKKFGVQFAKLEEIAPARSSVSRRANAAAVARPFDPIAEETEEDLESEDAPRSDIEALQQRYGSVLKQLEVLSQKLLGHETALQDNLKQWSRVWSGAARLQQVCDHVSEQLTHVNTVTMPFAQWPAEMERIKELEEVLTSEEIMASLKSLVASVALDSGDENSTDGSDRLRTVITQRQSLLDNVMQHKLDLNKMAVEKVTYRGKLREAETANKQISIELASCSQPVHDWEHMGVHVQAMQTLQQRLAVRQDDIAALEHLYSSIERHVVGDSGATTRHQYCCNQRQELRTQVNHLLEAMSLCGREYTRFQDGVESLNRLYRRCSALRAELSDSESDVDLETCLHNLSLLSSRLEASVSDEQEIAGSLVSMHSSPVPHSPAAMATLQERFERLQADRVACQSLVDSLKQEWQGVEQMLPRMQRLLRNAEDALSALQDVTEQCVPVGSDVEDNAEAFATQLSQAYHNATEANRCMLELTTPIPNKIRLTLNVPERLERHWMCWRRLEAEAKACQVAVVGNQDQWTSHRHDVELVEQWISGVLSSIRTLQTTSTSSPWKLKATAEELQALLSKTSVTEDTCAAQGAILSQILIEAEQFCQQAPLSEGNEIHMQNVTDLSEQLQTLVQEAEALHTATKERLLLLNKLDGFVDTLASLNGAATTSAECLESASLTSASASLHCLEGISSNFSNLQTTLDDLLSEAAALNATGILVEQAGLAQRLWYTLQQTVRETLDSRPRSPPMHRPPSPIRQITLSTSLLRRTLYPRLPAFVLLVLCVIIAHLAMLQS